MQSQNKQRLSGGVMVALRILVPPVRVRILPGQQKAIFPNEDGFFVSSCPPDKSSSHRPFLHRHLLVLFIDTTPGIQTDLKQKRPAVKASLSSEVPSRIELL